MKRHLQVRLVKDSDIPETEDKKSFELPLIEIQEVVHQIFVGIGALILVNAVSKIIVNKLS